MAIEESRESLSPRTVYPCVYSNLISHDLMLETLLKQDFKFDRRPTDTCTPVGCLGSLILHKWQSQQISNDPDQARCYSSSCNKTNAEIMEMILWYRINSDECISQQ